jgi:hypothetical protein
MLRPTVWSVRRDFLERMVPDRESSLRGKCFVGLLVRDVFEEPTSYFTKGNHRVHFRRAACREIASQRGHSK